MTCDRLLFLLLFVVCVFNCTQKLNNGESIAERINVFQKDCFVTDAPREVFTIVEKPAEILGGINALVSQLNRSNFFIDQKSQVDIDVLILVFDDGSSCVKNVWTTSTLQVDFEAFSDVIEQIECKAGTQRGRPVNHQINYGVTVQNGIVQAQ